MNIFKKQKNILNTDFFYILLIVLISLLLSAPLYTQGFYWSHDGVYHFSRNYSTNSGIISKQIPPLIVSNFCKNYGYSWNIFYPPLGTYISGFFSLFTSILDAMKLTIMLSIALSGISMFKLMKKISKNNNMSFITAIIYITAPYFLSDIYCRMAMGEVIAYMFFPLLFYGLYDIFYDSEKESYFLTIGALGIVLSHNISTLMAVVLSFIFVIFNIQKLFMKSTRKNIWTKLIINGSFIILISLFFYGPLLEHKMTTDYTAFVKGASKEAFLDHRIYPSQLIFGKTQPEWAYKLSTNKLNESMSFVLGLPIIVALLFTPMVFSKIKKEHKLLYIVTLCTGILFALMSTTLFPWQWFPKVPSVIQFPWRFLLISSFAFSIIAGVNIYMSISNLKLETMYILILVILIYSGEYITNSVKYDTEFDLSYLYTNTKLDGNQCAAYEYLPVKASNNLDYICERSEGVVILSGNATIKDEEKDGSYMKFIVEGDNSNVVLELPYIYYLGYDINVNGKKLKYDESENGFICINLTVHGETSVEVTYKGTQLEKITFIISVVSSIMFIVYVVYCNKNKQLSLTEKSN